MGEDFQNTGVQKSKFQGNVSVVTGDKVRADSDGRATKKMRKQDGFERSSEIEKVDQEPVLYGHGKGAYKPYPTDFDGRATKKMRKQDGFGRSSEMKVDQEPVLDRHGKGAKHKSAVRTKDESKVSGVESKKKNKELVYFRR